MKDFSTHAYVVGTAAMQANCSRYSNENERIISFPVQSKGRRFLTTDYRAIASSNHATRADRMHARLLALVQGSRAVRDLILGDLKGSSFEGFTRTKCFVAGCVYALVALCALFIAC